MTLYNFNVNTDENSPDRFYSVLPNHLSEAEQRNTPIAIHNYSKDLMVVRKLADEMINVSGAEVKVYARTDNADHDKVWDEDPDPTYWPPESIKAYFKPQPIESELKSWGVDAPNKTEIIFSHRQLAERYGERMLRPGDVIQVPYNAIKDSPKNFRILNASPSGNYRYTWLYIKCAVETLTADITVRVDNDLPPEGIIQPTTKYWES